MTITRMEQLRIEVLQELTDNILPFSMQFMVDWENGGFYGHVANDRTVRTHASKGLVQHSRMLWTFAHANRSLGDPEYQPIALHAQKALLDWFWDKELGGLFWMVDHRGQPLQTEKFTYGQAFAIYGLAEAHLAYGDGECLARAIELYRLLQTYCHDAEHDGYWEACQRDWTPIPDLHLDPIDLPVIKGMNTHLHVLEAYTNLLRAWDDADLRASLRALLHTLLRNILNPDSYQFFLYFDRAWQPLSAHVSYGHDIEGSWLLVEAAEVLGDPELLVQVQETALQMAYATLQQGVDADGGLVYEGDASGVIDYKKEWWPQAEAMVGFLNAYQMSGDHRFLDASLASWRFIQKNLVDTEHGEWFYSASEAGRSSEGEKAGMWKTPYHNARACLEVMTRIHSIKRRY
jgi:mannobiose 2-epimerase